MAEESQERTNKSEYLREIEQGFHIKSLRMKDAETGQILWENSDIHLSQNEGQE